MLFIITGATGNVGSHLIPILRQNNLKTHCIVRNQSKASDLESQGCSTSIANLNKLTSTANALERAAQDGPCTLFLLHPESFTTDLFVEAERFANNVAKAIHAAGKNIRRVVFLSTLGAEVSKGTGFLRTSHIIEEILTRELSNVCELFFIRAAYFFENWEMSISAVRNDAEAKAIQSFIPRADQKLHMVASKDIAACIARWMMKDSDGVGSVRVVQIVGPEEYSPRDVAVAVGEALNRRDIGVECIGEEGVRGLGKQLGWSETAIKAWLETIEFLKNGGADIGEALLLEKGRVTISQFCDEVVKRQ